MMYERPKHVLDKALKVAFNNADQFLEIPSEVQEYGKEVIKKEKEDTKKENELGQ